MGAMAFMQPDEMMTLFGSVSGGAASGYQDDWLVDGRPGRPAKDPGGSPAGVTWTITGLTSKLVTHVFVANHNLTALSDVTVGGGVSAGLVAPALGANGIGYNFGGPVAAQATINSMTVGFEEANCIIGEVIAGRLREVGHGLLLGARIRPAAGSDLPGSQVTSLPGYDDGWEQRAIDAEVVVNASDKALLYAAWQGTRGQTRPYVLVLRDEDGDLNFDDVWVGRFASYVETSERGTKYWRVAFTFVEFPRSRW